jgi:methylated-DNA-[protein]-cysteine S-methyltransferase
MNSSDTLFASLGPTSDDLTTLRARLGRAAAAGQLVDVSVTTTDSPVGRLLLAATERGLVRVAYVDIGGGLDDLLDDLSTRISPRVLEHRRPLEPALRQLDAYFDGSLHEFDVALDLRLAQGFRRRVVDNLRGIPYGQTATYAAVAESAGSPRAVRAVGTACALNPLPLVVPCHRVVRSDGRLGQYAGGAEVKQRLLALEGHLGRTPGSLR